MDLQLGMKKTAKLSCAFFALVMQSCLICTFVGGQGSIVRFPLKANCGKVLLAADELVEEQNAYVVRRFDGTGYDKGSRRLYSLKNQAISFDVHFIGDEAGWAGKRNFSEIALTFISARGIGIDADKKLSKNEREIYREAVAKIEKQFINPVRKKVE